MLIYIYCSTKGIWMGMIFGGTGIQTLILLIITIRCDWEGEVCSTYSFIYLLTLNTKFDINLMKMDG